MTTIGIVGSRRRNTTDDFAKVKDVFLALVSSIDGVAGDIRIVSGGCPLGADRFAEIIAKRYEHTITIHYAKWMLIGKRAGFARNGLIADQSDILIACVAPDRTGGTEDTISKWNARGLPKERLYIV